MKKSLILILLIFAGFIQLHGQSTSGTGKKSGLTQEDVDRLAIDPQSWDLQENMTWKDKMPNPVIN